MNRDQFLSEKWNRYPVLPEGARAWGRLVSLTGARLELRRGDRVTAIDATLSPLLGILREGDLVAVGAGGEAVLLAPSLAASLGNNDKEKTLRDWARFLAATRAFFEARGFTETPTPDLVPCPGTEPSLDVFETEFVRGSRRRRLFLPTSPELHLKKVLARGFEKIFEVKTCYRNGEITAHHQPEFTMLEWYRAYEKPEAIAEDLSALAKGLASVLGVEGPRRTERVSMADLFQRHLGVTLSPSAGFADYAKIAEGAGLSVRPSSTVDDVFFLIFLERIEKHFDPETFVIVDRWPPFQAALARLTPEGWGDRFEAYWRGLELANAFHELNDPEVQRRRFAEDLEKKTQMGRAPVPLDEDFLRALESGLPPSAGIALGLERLFMALTRTASISSLKLFPFED